jgi:Na+/H+ antiporter NhaD/arsenite permease-like protein
MRNRFLLLFFLSSLLGYLGFRAGLNMRQAIVVSVFAMSIIGTLFFWDFRLSFVFIGSSICLLVRAVTLDDFINFASLDVILFLISIMIIVGMMKESGFFFWIITMLLRIKNLNGQNLFLILMMASALFSALMGEVASIIIIVAVIFNITMFLEVSPLPLVISSIMATNIGSAATVLGNPVGVLIAARGGLSFEDFLIHAFPVTLFVLVIIIWILTIWYRQYIRDLTEKLKPFQEDKGFLYLISIPADRKTKISIGIFLVTIALVALHHRLELLLHLKENTLLIMMPVFSAGVVLIYRNEKAKYYVEREVEWNSLLFFMFLFAQAGVIQSTGVADFVARKIFHAIGNQPQILSAVLLWISGSLSSFLDNVVAVASFIPIVKGLESLQFDLKPLWWALLFGACYGGNITLIGSTANIVALGLLEKEGHEPVSFWYWLKIGLVVGLVSMGIALIIMISFPHYFAG